MGYQGTLIERPRRSYNDDILERYTRRNKCSYSGYATVYNIYVDGKLYQECESSVRKFLREIERSGCQEVQVERIEIPLYSGDADCNN